MSTTPIAAVRGREIARFVTEARSTEFPPEVVEGARKALVDFIGVAIGAVDEPLAAALRRTVSRWQASGDAFVILGARTTPALAALVNGTLVHAVEYDDQHPNGSGHPSAPCWSATLAVGAHHGISEKAALAAFITGYEITAKLGGGGPGGVGRTLQKRGFHPTSVFGRIGAAASTCAMLGHTEPQVMHAMGIAGTTAGGLLASFGTHCKPFHAGKAAMDGILSAQLALDGFEGANHLLELDHGLLDAFIQGGGAEVPPLDFGKRWELLRNGYKYYACCRATHSSFQTASSLADRVVGRRIVAIRARVHPNALVTAGRADPKTPLECKFSTPFCIAMGLRGYRGMMNDFSETTLRDSSVTELLPLVTLEAVPTQDSWTAHLEVDLADGTRLEAHTDVVKGHPDNPMGWDDLHVKFRGLVEPAMGAAGCAELYDTLCNFERPGSLRKMSDLLTRQSPPRAA